MEMSRNRGTERFLRRFQSRAKKGMDSSTSNQVARIMRFGPGSVDAQFSSHRGLSVTRGVTSWPATKPFGSCSPPSSTLVKGGDLHSAWVGRHQGSINDPRPHSVTIGVRGSVIHYASIHQRGGLVKAKTRTSSGRLLMQLALGLGECQIWFTEGRLLRGFRIPPRPVGISAQVLRRAGALVLGKWVADARAS